MSSLLRKCLLLQKLWNFIRFSSTNESLVLSDLTVYVSLLEQQSKYNDALEVLSGNLGSLFVIEVDKLRIQVNYKAF